MAENEDLGYEEGMLWLPTNVLDEACDQRKGLKYYRHQQGRNHLRSAAAEPLRQLQSRSTVGPQRTRFSTNMAFGGPGMQAVFLGSGQRSCGTGVFLPRGAGANFQSSNKPACPPVLLPARVVQALNLNVHELGLQIKAHRESSKRSKGVDSKLLKNKKDK